MIEAGMTGMRLNLSHTSLEKSQNYIYAYADAAKTCGVMPQLLIDMQGPELRMGALKEPLTLIENEIMEIPVPEAVKAACEVGDRILFDDGKLLVEAVSETEAEAICEKKNFARTEIAEVKKDCEEANRHDDEETQACVLVKVLRGGILQSGKSIKIQDKYVSMPALTEHDIENIKNAKAYGVTALMQPFVCNGETLRQVRVALKENGAEDLQIFAKIENRLGVEHIEEILPEADVIVIARGDLGNDMPLWELPAVQKRLEEACKQAGKPYIVVTQMLASMEKNPVPTRAEVSDIFHAVYHGAWGVMITGETAVGAYPVEAITYLANTAREAITYLANTDGEAEKNKN